MLQARCSLSVCPVYMRHKYVNMDVNSAFLKLTNAMLVVKIMIIEKIKFIHQDSLYHDCLCTSACVGIGLSHS